jgi:hypothetical protein
VAKLNFAKQIVILSEVKDLLFVQLGYADGATIVL